MKSNSKPRLNSANLNHEETQNNSRPRLNISHRSDADEDAQNDEQDEAKSGGEGCQDGGEGGHPQEDEEDPLAPEALCEQAPGDLGHRVAVEEGTEDVTLDVLRPDELPVLPPQPTLFQC